MMRVETGKGHWGCSLTFDMDDRRIVLHVALWLALWIGFDWKWARPSAATWLRWAPSGVMPSGKPSKYASGAREFRLALHHGAAWVSVWADPDAWQSGANRMAPWRSTGWAWSLNPIDILLGREACTREDWGAERHTLAMPAGDGYDASEHAVLVSWREVVVRRPRWPLADLRYRTEVEVVGDGVPHPGKGTAAYNCGEDALHSLSVPGILWASDAVDRFRDSVLENRTRYPL